jgi:hypothetical protein
MRLVLVTGTDCGDDLRGTARNTGLRGKGAMSTMGAEALAVHVLRVKPADRSEQFAADIADDRRQMFVAKANRVVAYGRVLELELWVRDSE